MAQIMQTDGFDACFFDSLFKDIVNAGGCRWTVTAEHEICILGIISSERQELVDETLRYTYRSDAVFVFRGGDSVSTGFGLIRYALVYAHGGFFYVYV